MSSSAQSTSAPRSSYVGVVEREVALRAAIPPRDSSSQPHFPFAVLPQNDALAPPPINDRYPIVIGREVSITYLSNCLRLSTTGYRQQLVDLLREIIEQDPHLFACVQKRILSVANGRFEIAAADVDEDDPDYEAAQELAKWVRAEMARIPNLTQTFVTLLWAIYYGVMCAEIMWSRDREGWHIDRLEFVHSRRIAWPDAQSWDAYIWDQGQVYGWSSPWGSSPTNRGIFGLRIADFENKFILFSPQLTGDYPTREGIGRETATWALFKRVGARGASQYLERFARGFMDVSWKTASDADPAAPREATKDDIAVAKQIAATVGTGSGAYAAHADAVTINPKSFDGGSGSKISWDAWIHLCNAEISKAVLVGTLAMDAGTKGARSLGEVQERGEVDVEQFDATSLMEAWREQVLKPLVRLNHRDKMHLLPKAHLHVDAEPDPKTVIENAERLTKQGVPLDADDLAEKVGFKTVPNETGKPRVTFFAKPVPMAIDPMAPPPATDDGKTDDGSKTDGAGDDKPASDDDEDDKPSDDTDDDNDKDA